MGLFLFILMHDLITSSPPTAQAGTVYLFSLPPHPFQFAMGVLGAGGALYPLGDSLNLCATFKINHYVATSQSDTSDTTDTQQTKGGLPFSHKHYIIYPHQSLYIYIIYIFLVYSTQLHLFRCVPAGAPLVCKLIGNRGNYLYLKQCPLCSLS